MHTNVAFRYFLFAMGFAGFVNTGYSAPFIVKNGKPDAEIVIAEKPARAAEFGAAELQAYLEKISGV